MLKTGNAHVFLGIGFDKKLLKNSKPKGPG